MTLSTLRCLLCAALCLLYLPARAQLTVDIAGAGTGAIPMAVAAFAGDAAGLDVAAVVNEAGFKLATLDLDTRQLRILTDSDADESPSFAPNGRLIALATTKGGQGILSLVSVDGRFRKQLAIAEGDLREPAWGPYPK